MNAWQRASRGIKSNWRLHLLSVFSVSVAFVCLGAAMLIVFNVDRLYEHWSNRGQLSVYLKQDAAAEDVANIEAALRASPDVVDVVHVTSDRAREEVLSADRDDLLSALPPEAFPESLEIRLSTSGAGDDPTVSRAAVTSVVSKLRQLPAVETVQTYEAWTTRLGSLLKKGLAGCGLLAIVVLAAVISVVSSTIRLTLQRRLAEVEVLKIIGATDSYVRRPFLIEGAAHGALGASLALTLLGVLFLIGGGDAAQHFTHALGMPLSFLSLPICGLMILAGVGLGVAAAFISLRRMLQV